jgi:retron-type reverse transcriptase
MLEEAEEDLDHPAALIEEADHLGRHVEQIGYTCVVDADLRKYFDTIPHERLMEVVRQRIADGRVLDLIESYLHAGIMDGSEFQESEQGRRKARWPLRRWPTCT